MPDPARMEAAVHEYVAAFAEGSADRAVAIFADDATVEDPVGAPIRRGRAEILPFYRDAMTMVTKLSLLGPVRIATDSVAFPFEIRLRWEGADKRIEVIDTFRFDEDNKVVEMRAFWGPENMHTVS